MYTNELVNCKKIMLHKSFMNTNYIMYNAILYKSFVNLTIHA